MRTSRVWRVGGRRRWTAHGALVLVFGLLISQLVTAHPASGASSRPSSPIFRRVAAPNASTGPVVGISSDPAGGGYWLVTSRGRVFPEGPRYWGSVHTTRATGPIIGIAANPTGTGYWLATSRGHVFALGHTRNWGSTTTTPATGPIVGITASPMYHGFWVVTRRGRVIAFGNPGPAAPARISGHTGLVVGIAANLSGNGYWIATAKAHIFARDQAPTYANSKHLRGIVVGIASGVSGRGYWMTERSALVVHLPPTTGPFTSWPTEPPPTSTPPTTTPTPPTTQQPAPAITLPPTPTTPIATSTGPGLTVTVPSNIPSDCSTDVTVALNHFFDALGPGTTVSFPAGGCYLVSQSAASTFLIRDTSQLTVDGNGSTLRQTTYLTAGGSSACHSNVSDRILTLIGNIDLTINGLAISGPKSSGTPYDCPGATSEGDAGIMIGSGSVGNDGVLLDNLTIQHMNGDDLDIYPHLSTSNAINSNVTIENTILSDWGWFGVVPEGVNGLTIDSDTIDGIGHGFMDIEVDSTCTGSHGPSYSYCMGGEANSPGIGVWNMAVVNNTFLPGSSAFITSQGPQACIPERNWTIAGNNETGAINGDIALNGSWGNPACPTDNTGLVVHNNKGAIGGSIYGGSIGSPPMQSGVDLAGWSDITYSNNQITEISGDPGYSRNITDAKETAGSTTITSPVARFTSSDVSHVAYVTGPGMPFGGSPIVGVENSTTATVQTPATATASNVSFTISASNEFADTLAIPGIDICGDNNIAVTNNTWNNSYPVAISTDGRFCGAGPTANTGSYRACGNIFGLTEPYAYYTRNPSTPHAPYELTPAPAADPLGDGTCQAKASSDTLMRTLWNLSRL